MKEKCGLCKRRKDYMTMEMLVEHECDGYTFITLDIDGDAICNLAILETLYDEGARFICTECIDKIYELETNLLSHQMAFMEKFKCHKSHK